MNNQNQQIIALNNKIIELEKIKNNLINENMRFKQCENEMIILRNKLNELENENKDLKNRVVYLNNLLNKEKNNNIQNDNKDKMLELMNELIKKENEIKEIKSIIPFDIKKGDKIMTVIFFSLDENIHFSLICKNTDKFSNIEQKLFEEYPNCQQEQYYFMANGIQINRYKTLEELQLKNSSVITMHKMEYE